LVKDVTEAATAVVAVSLRRAARGMMRDK